MVLLVVSIKDKILEATVLYPTGGSEAIKLALKIVRNSSKKKNKLTTTLIDSA
jgi:4-aminobutyrate aminotransferase-like enzyme